MPSATPPSPTGGGPLRGGPLRGDSQSGGSPGGDSPRGGGPGAAALAEVLPVGVLLAGDDGSVVYANPALVEIFEAPFPPALADLSAGEPFRAARALWRAADGRRQRCTLPDGRVLEGTWHRMAGGRSLTVTDATSDALIRRRLRQQNRALAELVAIKTELVSALLHEVRTPLTAARTMASLLPSSADDPVTDALERNLRRLEAVIHEIATISGIENGTLDVRTESVDLDRLLGEVCARLGAPAPVSFGTTAQGDPALLAEVFERLIVAVRAMGGAAEVSAGAADGQWRLSLPLPPDTPTDRLFTATSGHGNATALMFARAVLGRHDGSVGIEHKHLTVRLPLPVSPDRSSALPPGSAGPAA